jgi:hypothetical protein
MACVYYTQDKNPSPEAKQQFQRVAQAYEVTKPPIRGPGPGLTWTLSSSAMLR